jgi:hypothetical protein
LCWGSLTSEQNAMVVVATDDDFLSHSDMRGGKKKS